MSWLDGFVTVIAALAAQDDLQHDPQQEWERATRFEFDGYGPLGGPFGGRDLTLHFGGRLAVDFIRWDDRNSNENGFALGALRPLFDLDVGGRSQFRAEFDLDDVDSKRGAYDLWVRQEIGRHAAVQVGQVRVAMGSEYATREESLPLVGYSFTSYLTGRYDLGVRATFDGARDSLHLEGVATIGSGFGLEGEGKDDPFFMGRATLEPLRAHGPDWLKSVYVGAAFAWQPGFHDELLLATPYQTPVFTTPDLRGGPAAWGLVEAGWHCGPVRVGIEGVRGVITDVDVPGGGDRDLDELMAWTAFASVFLTGEGPTWDAGRHGRHRQRKGRIAAADADADSDGGPTFRLAPFSTPIELALRYSNADLDRALFTSGLTTTNPSTQEVRTAGANLVFHVAPGTRFQLGVVRTIAADDLAVFGGANRDTSYLARFEIDF
ncbi:MAG: hypothetical protein EXR73_00605 [Myxococcales bacterium]|nr:hypothetical protein [Myxococcales bacterium]